MVFVCYVILPDHVIRALHGVMVRSLSRSVTNLSSLVARSTVVVEL